jgi:hypothetical protein
MRARGLNTGCTRNATSRITSIMAVFQTGASIRRLRVTPAMAAGVTDKLWDISDVVTVLEKLQAATEAASSILSRRYFLSDHALTEKYFAQQDYTEGERGHDHDRDHRADI